MELHIDTLLDAWSGPHEAATNGPPISPAVRYRTSRATVWSTAGARASLLAAAGDIDHLCQEALESENFDAITRSVQASHAIHRALLAFDDVALAIG
jgi:hypothetical protein